MTEAAAACYITDPVYATPSIVESDWSASGASLTFDDTLIGDHIFFWDSSSSLTVPSTVPASYTTIGSGINSDASGNDCAARLSVKKVTANGEDGPAGVGGSRTIGVVVRDLDPNWISLFSSSWYAYVGTTGGNLLLPGLVLPRSCPVMCFTKKAGTTASPIPGLTEIVAASAANAECRSAWTAADVSTFAAISVTVAASTSSVGISVALPGRQTN